MLSDTRTRGQEATRQLGEVRGEGGAPPCMLRVYNELRNQRGQTNGIGQRATETPVKRAAWVGVPVVGCHDRWKAHEARI